VLLLKFDSDIEVTYMHYRYNDIDWLNYVEKAIVAWIWSLLV